MVGSDQIYGDRKYYDNHCFLDHLLIVLKCLIMAANGDNFQQQTFGKEENIKMGMLSASLHISRQIIFMFNI